MTTIEIVAAAFGLACVWLTMRQSVWCWPVGLVQVALYAWVFVDAKLYSDFLLHLVYVALQFYGWHAWLRGGPRQTKLPVSRIGPRAAAAWFVAAVAVTAALGTAMHRLTDAALPYSDAAIAVLSLVATYLLARKVLENWLVWVAVDVIAIGVYSAKALYVTAGLYAVFLALAVAGWFSWRTSYQRQTLAAASDAGAGSSSASSSPRTAATSS